MDFIAGRGYAIGDDGTALRTDDGGATWTGLATGTSQDLTRVQAVTPDVVVVLGGDGCVVRRSDDGGAHVPQDLRARRDQLPRPVAAAYFVTPAGRLPAAARRQRPAHHRRRRDRSAAARRSPARRRAPAAARASPPTRSSRPPTRASSSSPAATRRSARPTRARRGRPSPTSRPATSSACAPSTPTTFYAFGPDTLLRTTDAGQTWQRRARGRRADTITGISCATLDLCLLTTDRGDRLLRTENGGDTAESITASTAPLYAAGFATPTRAVAAGAGGATAVSDDGGRNYAPVGGDIAGSFQFGLRLGPAPERRARARRPRAARAHDRQRRDVAGDQRRDLGRHAGHVVLHGRRGLRARPARRPVPHRQRRPSWQPIDPGTTAAPRAVITTGDVVLLAGPRGVRRASGGGEFSLAGGARPPRAVDQFDRAGSAIFAYGSTAIVRTTNGGRRWTAFRGPTRRVGRRTRPLRLRDVEMTSGIARLRARHAPAASGARPTAAAAGPSCRASAPTTGSRSRSGPRRRASSRSTATRPTTTSPTCCARATAAGTGARSGSRAAASRAPRA